MTQRLLSVDELAAQTRICGPSDPKFALLIGAGASASSGIETGGQLVRRWREEFDKLAGDGPRAEEQSWFGKSSEYGKLFEFHYSTPASRREFIEGLVDKGRPSWGYLYLSQVLEHGFFNAVLTTNFDDLVNEACHAFTSNVRPLVCGHDSAMNQFRMSGKRPKVLKLHGDFLYDNLANTTRETANLPDITTDKITWLAREYGLIVSGYSGGDESVMSVVARLLHDQQYFPHGMYWCLASEAELPLRLEPFAETGRLKLVQCSDFDELMAAVYQVHFDQPPLVVRDFGAAMADRCSHLVAGLSIAASADDGPVNIARDRELLARAIANEGATPSSGLTLQLPREFIATCHFHTQQYVQARELFRSVITGQSESAASSCILFFECLRYDWEEESFQAVLQRISTAIRDPRNDFSWICNSTLSLIHGGKYDEALMLCDLADQAFEEPSTETSVEEHKIFNELNRLQIELHRGNELSATQRDRVARILESSLGVPVDFGCLILLDRGADALELFTANPDQFPRSVPDWPIIDLLSAPRRELVRKAFPEGTKHYAGITFKFPLRVQYAAPGQP